MHVRTIRIDSLIYGQTQLLVVLVLAFIASTGVMACSGLFRLADRVLYAMNRRSATCLGMTIALRSGPF